MKKSAVLLSLLLILIATTSCAKKMQPEAIEGSEQAATERGFFDRLDEGIEEMTQERHVTVLGQDVIIAPEDELQEGKLLKIEF